MIGLLADYYTWIKAMHLVSVISWMAGIFYLPRLFVYHAERIEADLPEAAELFQTMERRLLRGIMNPAMIATWVFGLMLVAIPGVVDWSASWSWVKAGSVLVMTWFHMWLAARRRDFAEGKNRLTGRRYRMMNELPTLLLLLIIFAVIVKF